MAASKLRPQTEDLNLDYHPEQHEPVGLDIDKEPWERQSRERILYFRWFQRYLDQDPEKLKSDRQVPMAYNAIDPGVSRHIFREVARVWRWPERGEAFDEHVFRRRREAYMREVELMAARQAAQAVRTQRAGSVVIRRFAEEFRNRRETLRFDELVRLLPTAIRAVEVGHREERLARGFGRAVVLQQGAESDVTRIVGDLEKQESPEIEALFRELEQLLVGMVAHQ